MLEQITPLVLTFNEAPNIGRTLSALSWARRIVVIDSFSTDGTVEIARRFENVRVLQRKFDRFDAQWNFGLASDWIESDWVLALDADYLVTPESQAELAALQPPAGVAGYTARFSYCIDGRPLRGSLYPPVTVLFRRDSARFEQDGHAYRLRVLNGRVESLRSRLLHDDRKPLTRWLLSQERYASDEAAKLRATAFGDLSWADRARRVPLLSAPLVGLHCLLVKGCMLDGKAGLRYAGERVIAELMISLKLLDRS